MRQLLITVSLRRTESGYLQLQFAAGDLDSAYAVSAILVRSPEYGHCYAVGTDWQGRQVLVVRPEDVQPPLQPVQAPTQIVEHLGGPYRSLPERTETAWTTTRSRKF